MEIQQKLFTEQLRPKTLDQAIVIPRIKQELSKGLVDNLLFYGPPGTGKCLDYDEELDIAFDERWWSDYFASSKDKIGDAYQSKYLCLESGEMFYWFGVKIGDMFKFLNLLESPYDDVVKTDDIRLDSSKDNPRIYVRCPEVDNGKIIGSSRYRLIKGYVRKSSKIHEYYLQNQKTKEVITLRCSHKHLVLNENLKTVKISDAREVAYSDDTSQVKFYNIIGESQISLDNEYDSVYDIALEWPHLYYLSNGIINHNTTLSKIVASGHPTLEINASLERGIETIRDKVISFASSSSLLDGKDAIKVVMLEECDNLTADAWASLRSTIERFHKTTRFIGNCNYIEKIPEPIKSRFNCIPLLPINSKEEDWLTREYVVRIKQLLDALKIGYAEEEITEFIAKDFPDMRTLIKKVQQMFTRGVKNLADFVNARNFASNEMFEILTGKPDPVKTYDYVMREWASKPEDGVLMIGKEFPEYMIANCKGKENKLGPVVITIAEHNEQLSRVTDKVITLLSLIYKLQRILQER